MYSWFVRVCAARPWRPPRGSLGVTPTIAENVAVFVYQIYPRCCIERRTIDGRRSGFVSTSLSERRGSAEHTACPSPEDPADAFTDRPPPRRRRGRPGPRRCRCRGCPRRRPRARSGTGRPTRRIFHVCALRAGSAPPPWNGRPKKKGHAARVVAPQAPRFDAPIRTLEREKDWDIAQKRPSFCAFFSNSWLVSATDVQNFR
jgi:hypothetical protein